AALRSMDPSRPALGRLLWGAAYKAGCRARSRRVPVPVPSELWDSVAPPMPFGHPDLVLADAVGSGVIDAFDAELIGRTRIENQRLTQAAADLGMPYQAARRRRARAERLLVAAITHGRLAGPGVYQLLHPDAA
ncbi:MAG: hypothetical protein L0Y54_23090, partial [Sporichthyaceae bacterium]|nr:hypothetical protein [Sporichthyaceae bacterium]